MNQFLEFLLNHWILWSIFFVLLLVLVITELRQSRVLGVLSCSEVTHYINTKQAVVLDIRSEDNFKQGHIAGSINIPLDQLNSKSNKLEKYKTKPIIIVCETGRTVISAIGILRKQQYPLLHSLKGGLANWRKDNLPLIKA